MAYYQTRSGRRSQPALRFEDEMMDRQMAVRSQHLGESGVEEVIEEGGQGNGEQAVEGQGGQRGGDAPRRPLMSAPSQAKARAHRISLRPKSLSLHPCPLLKKHTIPIFQHTSGRLRVSGLS